MSMWLCRAGRYGEFENKFLEDSKVYRRPMAEIPAPRRFPASLIGSGPLRRPRCRSLRGGNPHSAGNHRRRPAFPSPHAFYSRFRSPHSHIPSRMGIRDFPLSVRLYSTFGGICGYSSRWTSWSASSSFKVVLRVL